MGAGFCGGIFPAEYTIGGTVAAVVRLPPGLLTVEPVESERTVVPTEFVGRTVFNITGERTVEAL